MILADGASPAKPKAEVTSHSVLASMRRINGKYSKLLVRLNHTNMQIIMQTTAADNMITTNDENEKPICPYPKTRYKVAPAPCFVKGYKVNKKAC
jgi:hypothetical protein